MILQLIECGLAGCQLFGIAPLETVALAVVTVFGMALVYADVFAEVVLAIGAVAVLIPVLAAAGRAAFVVAGALLVGVTTIKFATDLVTGARSGGLSVPLLSLVDTVLSWRRGGGKQGGKPPEKRQRQSGNSPNLFKDDDD